MTLVAPLALLLLLLIGPIVWLFLRRPPVPSRAVSSLLLARTLAQLPQRRRKLPREEFLPLALVLVALCALVAGVALRPADADRPLVVVLDDSETSPLRADAHGVGPALAPWLDRHADATITVVGLDPVGIRVLQTTDPTHVQAAIAASPTSLPAGDPTDLLHQLCATHQAQILVVGAVPAATLPPDCPAAQLDVPLLPATEARVTAWTASSPSSTGDVWVHAQAVGATTATVTAGGAPVGTLRLTASGSSIAEGVAQVSVPPGSALQVVLDGDAGAAGKSTVALPKLPVARTLVRTASPNGYLATLARLHPRLRTTVQSPQAPSAGSWDLVLTDADAPVQDEAAVVAVFGRGAPELGIEAGPVLVQPEVLLTAPDHPLVAQVAFDSLFVERATTLAAPTTATVLASTRRGPVAVARPLPAGGTAVVVGIGLEDSDLPLRADFVHLVANLVDLAAPEPPPPAPAPARSVAAALSGPQLGTDTRGLAWWWMVAVAGVALLLETALRVRPRAGQL